MAPETGHALSRGRAGRAALPVWLLVLAVVFYPLAGVGPIRGEALEPDRPEQAVFSLELWDEELRRSGRWFPLGSRVVARVLCRGLPPGRHELSLAWFNPGGREVERNLLKVMVPATDPEKAQVRASAWLKLNQGLLARTFGLKKGSHLGRWEVRLFWRGREVCRGWFVLG